MMNMHDTAGLTGWKKGHMVTLFLNLNPHDMNEVFQLHYKSKHIITLS